MLYGFLETYQTYGKKPLVWRNHTKAKGWKKPGHIFHNFLTYFLTENNTLVHIRNSSQKQDSVSMSDIRFIKQDLDFHLKIFKKKGFHTIVRCVIKCSFFEGS